MRKSMLLLVALTLMVIPGVASSTQGWIRAWDNEDFHVNVPVANDLHVTYYSDTKMRLISHFDNGFPIFAAVPTGPDSMQWSCTWSGQSLVFCQWVHVGVEFEQAAANKIWKKDIYWTLNGIPQNPQPPFGPINGPGFTVSPPSGRTTRVFWRFRNNGTSAMVLRSVQFRTAPTPTPLPDMMYNLLPGWENPKPDIPIAPDSFFDVYMDIPSVDHSLYLMAQGQVYINGELEGHFVMQHEHPVGFPTVTTWGLAVLALALLSLAFVMVRRTRRAAA